VGDPRGGETPAVRPGLDLRSGTRDTGHGTREPGAGSRRGGGKGRGAVEEPKGSGAARRSEHAPAAVVLCVLAAVFLLGLGMSGLQRDGHRAAMWLIALTPALVGAAFVVRGYEVATTWWVLRQRGVKAIGTYRHYEPSADPELSGTRVYSFTDATGAAREFRGGGRSVGADPDRIEITYDPKPPFLARRTTARQGPVRTAAVRLAWVLLGVPVALATVLGVALGLLDTLAAF
jgi:hypothetical protein